jgi:hypothetical protein
MSLASCTASAWLAVAVCAQVVQSGRNRRCRQYPHRDQAPDGTGAVATVRLGACMLLRANLKAHGPGPGGEGQAHLVPIPKGRGLRLARRPVLLMCADLVVARRPAKSVQQPELRPTDNANVWRGPPSGPVLLWISLACPVLSLGNY